MTYPLPHEVTLIRRSTVRRRDELGNFVTESEEVSTPVKVAGWAAPTSAEPKLAGHERLTVDVELYAPVGVFTAGDAVILPGRAAALEVIGEPENYEHSPFGWSPGLEVVNLRGVQ